MALFFYEYLLCPDRCVLSRCVVTTLGCPNDRRRRTGTSLLQHTHSIPSHHIHIPLNCVSSRSCHMHTCLHRTNCPNGRRRHTGTLLPQHTHSNQWRYIHIPSGCPSNRLCRRRTCLHRMYNPCNSPPFCTFAQGKMNVTFQLVVLRTQHMSDITCKDVVHHFSPCTL